MVEKGVTSAVVTYTNNDYNKGLSDSIARSFEALGGTGTNNAAHEDGKADYGAEVAALSAAGGEVVIGGGCYRVSSRSEGCSFNEEPLLQKAFRVF